MNISKISNSIIQSDFEYLKQYIVSEDYSKSILYSFETSEDRWRYIEKPFKDQFWIEVVKKKYFDNIFFIDYFKDYGISFWIGCVFLSNIDFYELINKFEYYLNDPVLLQYLRKCQSEHGYLTHITWYMNGLCNYDDRYAKLTKFFYNLVNYLIMKRIYEHTTAL